MYHRKLNETGYELDSTFTELYEAQIPALFRMFHIRNISPSGWVALCTRSLISHKKKSTSCRYEFTIDFNDIIPLPDKETVVPYKICSFDIEASSSHGDFPLAKKEYKKLATNIIDVWHDEIINDKEYLNHIVSTAFRESVIRITKDGF